MGKRVDRRGRVWTVSGLLRGSEMVTTADVGGSPGGVPSHSLWEW